MCLDTTETAGIPEPFSSPAGGQECTSVCRCVGFYSARVFFMCDCVHEFNKLTGPRSTICLHNVWSSRSWLWGTPLSPTMWDKLLMVAPVYCLALFTVSCGATAWMAEVYSVRQLSPLCWYIKSPVNRDKSLTHSDCFPALSTLLFY